MKFDKEIFLRRLKKAAIITLWVMLSGGVVFSLSFVNREKDELTCSKIIVNIEPENELQFVDREMVLKTIRPDGDENRILGKKITALHLPSLETRLEANKLIRDAEVFTDMNGIVHINIHQREPVLRVFNTSGESYYIDRNGAKMPVSATFTARVPVATGNIFEVYKDSDSINTFVLNELYKIATYVDKDAFWKAQIEQIFVTAESELVIIPKIGDHTINFGTTEQMEDKFGRLLLFYKEALSRVGWDKYSAIDLRFKNQIVCKKKQQK